jgi:hypothetical protein
MDEEMTDDGEAQLWRDCVAKYYRARWPGRMTTEDWASAEADFKYEREGGGSDGG